MTQTYDTLPGTYVDDLSYSDICVLTAHNAHTYNWKVHSQQSMDVEEAVKYGVRSFMIDIWDYKGVPTLCHNQCKVLSHFQKLGSLETAEIWFKKIQDALVKHPKAILTVHVESYIPSENINNILNSTGLSKYLLTSKNPNDLSLTLGDMRNNSERLVIFSDYGEGHKDYIEKNFSKQDKSINKQLLGIYPTTEYKETQYDLGKYRGCQMRTDYRADPYSSKKLFVFNHLYSFKFFRQDYSKINSYENVTLRSDLCTAQIKKPNFFAGNFERD